MDIKKLGWNQHFQGALSSHQTEELSVGRVALEHKRSYRLFTPYGELLAELSGKFRFQAEGRQDYPAVGDWVVIAARPEEGKATIHALLPRKSQFIRKAAGTVTEEQIVAANVDTIFLVTALNQDFNVRRLERYLLMAWESGATPVIVLSKADLCQDIEEKVQAAEAVAIGVPIHVISSWEKQGLDQLAPYMEEGQTVALLGSSGVGKSTLANVLYGEEILRVNAIREDDGRGRHTTTHRELLLLPNGGILIDTPGMRELQVWETEDSLEHTFQDIEALAEQCKFRNCQHDTEPNCAVKQAIEAGTLESQRYQSYVKLQKELAYLERKTNKKAQLAEKEKWKKVSSQIRKKNQRKR